MTKEAMVEKYNNGMNEYERLLEEVNKKAAVQEKLHMMVAVLSLVAPIDDKFIELVEAGNKANEKLNELYSSLDLLKIVLDSEKIEIDSLN